MRDKKGYVAIIIACFIPVVMSLLYLSINRTSSSLERMIFENAVRQSALEAARNYMCGVSLKDQKDYTERCAATAFNAAMKSLVGLKTDVIPMKENRIGYSKKDHSWFGYFQKSLLRNCVFYESWVRPEVEVASTIDPDADELEYICASSHTNGYFMRRSGSSSGTLIKKIYYKDTDNLNNTAMTISENGDDNLTVSVEAKLSSSGKTYKASYTATRPQLNADIVIGIPVNDGAMWRDNDMYSGFVAQRDATMETPLYQIKSGCKKFIREMLSYKKCGIGIIPYAGKVAVESPELAGNVWSQKGMKTAKLPQIQTISHGSYDYSNYAAVNPQVPLSESYKWISCTYNNGAGSLSDYESASKQSAVSDIVGLMHRADLITQRDGGDIVNTNAKDVLLSQVDNNTVFLEHPIWAAYGGDANIVAGFSRAQAYYHPMSLPMLGLTNKKIEMYRYCSFLSIFGQCVGLVEGVHFKNRSSFVYLPVMFGMSMLSNGFVARDGYAVSGNGNKKVLILFVNQPDLFHQHELTHFGFSNDASYFTFVDGDRLDYEKGLLTFENGYYVNKQFTEEDYKKQPGGIIDGFDSSGEFITKYNENVSIRCTYPKDEINGEFSLKMPQPANLKIVTSQDGTNETPFAEIYVENGHESGVSVTNVTTSGTSKIVQTAAYYTCYVDDSTNGNTFTVTFSDPSVRTNPVFAKIALYGCEVDSTSSSKWVVKQDTEFVYICYDSTPESDPSDPASDPSEATFSITLKQASSETQHDALAYAGRRVITSSTKTIETGHVTSYDFGNVYNVSLGGDYSCKFEHSKENTCAACITTVYKYCTGYQFYNSTITYDKSTYGVRGCRRLWLGWNGQPSGSGIWDDDFYKGNEAYGRTDVNLFENIVAEFKGADNSKSLHAEPKIHVPLVRVYKKQPHSDVIVTNLEYVWDNKGFGRYVLDMGDYFVGYSPAPNNTFRITISNPNNCKSVYVQMELFGLDIESTAHSKCVYRHDANFLYMCHNGNDVGANESFDVSFTHSNGCVATTPLSHFAGYLLPVTYNGTYTTHTSDYNPYYSIITEITDKGGSISHVANSGIFASDYDKDGNYEAEGVGLIAWTFVCYNAKVSSKDNKVYWGRRNSANEGWNTSDYWNASFDDSPSEVTTYQHGFDLNGRYNQSLRFIPLPMGGKKYTGTSYKESYLQHTLVATPLNIATDGDTSIKRNYKGKDAGDELKIPHVVIYKKPGHYVPSDEGSTNVTEYETVDKVERGKSSGVIEKLEGKSSGVGKEEKEEEERWIVYCPEGIKSKKEGNTITWFLDEENTHPTIATITLKEKMPMYPVLVKMQCFYTDVPRNENNAEIDKTRTRQDGDFYYLCNRTYATADARKNGECPSPLVVYNRPAIQKEEQTWWELGYANMFLLGADKTEDANGTNINTKTCTFVPKSSNYAVYGCNCTVTAKANGSYNSSTSARYRVPGKLENLTTYASHTEIKTNEKYSCDYIDYYCTYNGYPNGALLDSSICYIKDVRIERYASKTRAFKKVPDAKSKIVFSGAYSRSYELTSSKYNAIYIPRDSLSSGDLSFFLERTKIISIEWTNHLNGTEGCYECSNSNGSNSDSSENNSDKSDSKIENSNESNSKVDIYYEPLKRGKNCRWVNFRSYRDSHKYPFEHTSLYQKTDTNGYEWSGDSFFLQGNVEINQTRTILYLYTNPMSDFPTAHGDFNVIADNAKRFPKVNVWSTKTGDSHITEFTYMHGVERYFQRHLDTRNSSDSSGNFNKDGGYNDKTGTDRFGLVFRVTPETIDKDTGKVTEEATRIRLGIAECSNEVNRILMGAGYQKFEEASSGDGISDNSGTGLPNKSSTDAMRTGLTPDIIKKFNATFGNNGRIYVIHYRYNPDDYKSSGWDPSSWGVCKNYNASTEAEINDCLKEILYEIEEFAGYKDAKIINIDE